MKTGKFTVHHLGVAVKDIAAAIEFYQTALGFTSISKIFDDPIQKVKVCFLTNEPNRSLTVEVISPSDVASPINGYLSKGLGAYHICYEVEHLEESLESLRAKGCVLIAAPVPAVAFDGRRIAWCLTPPRHLVELVEARGPASSKSGE